MNSFAFVMSGHEENEHIELLLNCKYTRNYLVLRTVVPRSSINIHIIVYIIQVYVYIYRSWENKHNPLLQLPSKQPKRTKSRTPYESHVIESF